MKVALKLWLLGFLGCLLAVSSTALPVQVVSPNDASLKALSFAVLSDGWPVRTLALNNSGTVAFAAGGNPFSADGIVLVTSDSFFKFAAVGDPVPGFPGKVFLGFNAIPDGTSWVSLNDRNEVAFSGAFMTCNVTDIYQCLASGEPLLYGLFVYSNGRISKIVSAGDPAPDSGGRVFQPSGYQPWLNNRGEVVFNASIGPAGTSGGAEERALFMYSAGGLQKVALQNDPTPIGAPFRLDSNQFTILFNDQARITFLGSAGVFHYADGVFTKDFAVGDPAPGGGTFLSLFDLASNAAGDVAFRAKFATGIQGEGFFLRRRDGSMVRVLAQGDPTPLGGTYKLWSQGTTRGGTIIFSVSVTPRLNESGSVIFDAPIEGAASSTGLFLYTPGGNITAIPDVPLQQPALQYMIGARNTVTVSSGTSGVAQGLFQIAGGNAAKVAALGDPAPGAPGSTLATRLSPFVQNDVGDVAFWSGVCCGTFKEGVFLSINPRLNVPNRDFEVPSDTGRAVNWGTVWHNSGSGDASVYTNPSDVMNGASALRLHVNRGGGSTFVVSDAKAASPDTTYAISVGMRYNLVSEKESVYFSVIQFDAAGNVVGFDEIRGIKGESFWQWKPQHLSIHTAPTAQSIRIRFGLISEDESYLDVDSLR